MKQQPACPELSGTRKFEQPFPRNVALQLTRYRWRRVYGTRVENGIDNWWPCDWLLSKQLLFVRFVFQRVQRFIRQPLYVHCIVRHTAAFQHSRLVLHIVDRP